MGSPPVFSIALISASALAYEVLLIRLFSIIQWHHFAYMIISLALLGYGASGTFLALVGRRLGRRFVGAYVINASLFGATAVGSFLLAQSTAFNPLELLWDPRQPLWLLLMYLLLMLPFFLAANCIALTLQQFRDRISRIYSFDLMGAGAGSLGVVLVLFAVPGEYALRLVAILPVLAGALVWVRSCRGARRWGGGGLLLLQAALIFAVPSDWTHPRMSAYKELSQALRVAGAETIASRSSPLGLLTVVQNDKVPFRHAPGLSLNAADEPPKQLGLFTDGDALTVITQFDGRRDRLRYLDYLPSALPYHLIRSPSVLVLGAGGGADVLQARYHGAPRIDAVELNPQVVDLVRNDYREFSGDLYPRSGASENVRVHVDEARGFVAGSGETYDLIQLALLDSFNASSAGLYALSESHLYTVEALQDYIRHLNKNGILAITRWVKLPPRDGIKLFATAVAALAENGIAEPGARLAWIRSWNTSTLLIKNGTWSARDISTLRGFCRSRSFDVAYFPGIKDHDANRINILDRPYFYESAQALLGAGSQDFLERYKFQVRPATDDRPYFFNFFKWETLPEIMQLRTHGGVALLELGYLILVATLVQAVLASLVLILMPLRALKRRRSAGETCVRRGPVLIYFLVIGLAFLFVEIAFIQKFILFLSHPLYAVAVVLSGFLVFAGIGSRFSDQRLRGRERVSRIGWPVMGIVAFSVLYLLSLPSIFRAFMQWPDASKILLSLGLIAPLAFCMGIPFPRGLARLAEIGEELLPWAWGINGCASVVSAVLATVLAIHFGFTVVVASAVGLYAVAWAWGPQTFAVREGLGRRPKG